MASHRTKWQTPTAVFQPEVYQGMRAGMNKIVDAIRPTLGPLPRLVVNEKESKIGRPELLDDGATIARRIIQLPNRDEDVGAMYIRHVLWSLHEKVGDGTATAAVMFQKIFNEGVHFIVAGGNAMRLRQHLESASKVIFDELHGMVIHLKGREQLARLAETICYDPPLARMLAEIFDTIGEYGQLEIRAGRSRELEREYVEGMHWEGGILSREMITDIRQGHAQLENTAILISDLEIHEVRDLLPVIDAAVRGNYKALLLVANTVSARALSLVLTKPNREKIQVVAVKAPALESNARREAMEDLAILTGGRAFFQAAGDSFQSVRPEDLGQARRAWATPTSFGIVGGKGTPRELRKHIARLRAAYANIDDPKDRKGLQERIGKLIGGSAVLWAGASTPVGIEVRKALAERTAEAMRGALRDGVLPGGGVALLACQPVLQERYRLAQETEERFAYYILQQAVEMPIRTLLDNAGFNPDKVLGQVASAGPGGGFDVIRGQPVNMIQAGVYDSASVVEAACLSAIHGAALALTVDVIVHRRVPPPAYHST